MAVALRALSTVTGLNDQATVPIPATASPGDLLIVVISTNDGAALITPPAGWTEEAEVSHSSNFAKLAVYSRLYQSGDGDPVFTFSNSFPFAASMTAWSGADDTTPINAKNSASADSGTSGNINCPSVTTTVDDCLLFCAYTVDRGNVSYAPPSGMTERIDLNQGSSTAHGVASQQLGAAGATGGRTAVASTTNISWVGFTMAIAPAAGGGGAGPVGGAAYYYHLLRNQ
jgi:hypothetical protein